VVAHDEASEVVFNSPWRGKLGGAGFAHHTNKHEGKHHTDESKNEAVAGMLTVGFFRSSLGRCPFGGAMTWSPPKFQIGTPDNIRLLGNICD